MLETFKDVLVNTIRIKNMVNGVYRGVVIMDMLSALR